MADNDCQRIIARTGVDSVSCCGTCHRSMADTSTPDWNQEHPDEPMTFHGMTVDVCHRVAALIEDTGAK